MQENNIDLKSVLLLKTFPPTPQILTCIYSLSAYTIHILQICVCSLNIVEWDGFKVLSGCIRPEGRLLFIPVEWWSHNVSKLTFR